MTEVRNFTSAEFEASQVATRNRWGNQVPSDLAPNAIATLQMLQRIRDFLSARAGHDVPMQISSGYRSPRLNLAVGGSAISDHVKALAADWTAPAFGTPFAVCQALEPEVDRLGIGQLIHEFGAWIHTSVRPPLHARNRIITVSHAGTYLGIERV